MAIRLPDWRIVGGASSGGAGAGKPIEEIPAGPRNGVNRTFTLSHTPAAGYPILLFLAGIYQNRFILEYTNSGATITYAIAPSSIQNHVIVYWIGAGGSPTGLGARQFSGGTDLVNWGHFEASRLLGDMSFGVWLSLPSSAFGTIVARNGLGGTGTGDNTPYALAVDGSSGAWAILYQHDTGSGSGAGASHSFATAIPNDSWRYIGFSRNSTAKTVTMYVYDGLTITTIGTYTYSNDPDGGTDSDCDFKIGQGEADTSASWGPLVGTVKEYYLWNRALSSDEHFVAATGNPSLLGMILGCTTGNDPERDISGAGRSGAVTGTTLVQGH